MSALMIVAWHLAGFLIFGLLSWGALTLLLMMPESAYWWAAWAIAATLLIKVVLLVVALCCGLLAFAWLIKPAEMD